MNALSSSLFDALSRIVMAMPGRLTISLLFLSGQQAFDVSESKKIGYDNGHAFDFFNALRRLSHEGGVIVIRQYLDKLPEHPMAFGDKPFFPLKRIYSCGVAVAGKNSSQTMLIADPAERLEHSYGINHFTKEPVNSNHAFVYGDISVFFEPDEKEGLPVAVHLSFRKT